MIIGEDVYINEITSITRPELIQIGNCIKKCEMQNTIVIAEL